mgnify:CR=1 FL=1
MEKKKFISGVKTLNNNKVALMGVNKKTKQPEILAYADINEGIFKQIPNNDDTYEVEVQYSVGAQTTDVVVKNIIKVDNSTPRTLMYDVVATSATIMAIRETPNYIEYQCKIDDNNTIKVNAWRNADDNAKNFAKVKEGDRWAINITIAGGYAKKWENSYLNNFSGYLKHFIDAEKRQESVVATKEKAEPQQNNEVKKYNFAHLKKYLEEKQATQASGMVQMGFCASYNDISVFNIADIETFEYIANDSQLNNLVADMAKYKKHIDPEYDFLKLQLPCIFPMGYTSNGGAKDKDMVSNGLFFYDYDGDSEEEMLQGIDKIMNTEQLKANLMLLCKSPSLNGFHAIFKPFNAIDNVNQNQIFVDNLLQMPKTHDKACKNIGRKKFMVPMGYIRYINKQIFETKIDTPLTPIGDTKKYTRKFIENNTKTNTKTNTNTTQEIDYSYPITEDEMDLINFYVNENDYVKGNRHNALITLTTDLGKNKYPIARKHIYMDYIENRVQNFKNYDAADDPTTYNEQGVSQLTSILQWADNEGVIKNNVLPDEQKPLALRDSYTWEEIVRAFNAIEYPQIVMDNMYAHMFAMDKNPSKKTHYMLPNQIIATAVLLTPHLSGVEILDPSKETHSIILQALHCATSSKRKSALERNKIKGFGVVCEEEDDIYNKRKGQLNETQTKEYKKLKEKYRKDNISFSTNEAALFDNFKRIDAYNRGVGVAFTPEFDKVTSTMSTGAIGSEVLRMAFDGAALDKDTATLSGVNGKVRCKISFNATGTLGSLKPLISATGSTNNGTVNRMIILPNVSPKNLLEGDAQYYDCDSIKKMIEYLRSIRDVVIDAKYLFGDIYEEIKAEYITNYTDDIINDDDMEPIIGRAMANAERVCVVYYLIYLYEQGLILTPSNEKYTYTTIDERQNREVENQVTNTYNEEVYIPVCVDNKGNLVEMPTANEELLKLFRLVFQTCVHGQYKLFAEHIAADAKKIDSTFIKIAQERKQIIQHQQNRGMADNVFAQLGNEFTKQDLQQLYMELKATDTVKDTTIRSWVKRWKDSKAIEEKEGRYFKV